MPKKIILKLGIKNMSGKLSGLGLVKYSNGESYIGLYKNGRREGKGIYKYSDGSKYYGEWKNGKQHGVGKMIYSSGEFIKCNWIEGKEHGTAEYHFLDGSKAISVWSYGEIIENHDSSYNPWMLRIKNRFRKKTTLKNIIYNFDNGEFFSKKTSKYIRKY